MVAAGVDQPLHRQVYVGDVILALLQELHLAGHRGALPVVEPILHHRLPTVLPLYPTKQTHFLLIPGHQQ